MIYDLWITLPKKVYIQLQNYRCAFDALHKTDHYVLPKIESLILRKVPPTVPFFVCLPVMQPIPFDIHCAPQLGLFSPDHSMLSTFHRKTRYLPGYSEPSYYTRILPGYPNHPET